MPALPACWEVVTTHWQDYIYNFEAKKKKKKKQLDVMSLLSNIREERKEKFFKIEIAQLLLPDSLKL